MFTKLITISSKCLVILSLVFFAWNPSFGQTCGGGDDKDVHLTGIGEITVEGAANSAEAEKAYKQALADAAKAGGLAACAGACTVGTCEMRFKKYKSGSSTPNSTTKDGNWVFDKPSNGDQKFSVKCPCIVKAAVLDITIYEGGEVPFDPKGGGIIAANEATFSLYPNPASTYITLQAELASAAKNSVTVRIVDVQGQVMVEKELGMLSRGNHHFDIDMMGFAPGIYFATIHEEGRVVSHSKIMIQK